MCQRLDLYRDAITNVLVEPSTVTLDGWKPDIVRE